MTVTDPRGFRASGVTAGLKTSGCPDVALIVNDGPQYHAAGVFTSNRVVAAPVVWSQKVVANGAAKAIILNSGCANACTGAPGARDAQMTADYVGKGLGVAAEEILVCSTGMIGLPMNMEKLLPGVDVAIAALDENGGNAAATAIMTTDTVAKTAEATIDFAGKQVRVGGIAKGAGMLAPGLATMLVAITTDAGFDALPAGALQESLNEAVRTTFNRIDSDACMSTNDTVLVIASGASGVDLTAEQLPDFTEALRTVCGSLARQLIADAEGASHDISVTVRGATTENAGEAVARAITRSNLFKVAVFGNDPNWGRILSAAGTVPADVAPYDPEAIDVSINGVMVCRDGGVGDDRNLVDMGANREVHVLVELHAGDAEVTMWTNDLTHDYVHENSAYST